MNRLLLIDGSYYVYRSFHAHRDLTNARGEPTGAIYGFVRAITRMLRHLSPTHCAVVWDGIPRRRQELQPGYKQHREGRPEEMTAQWPVIERIVPMMGIQSVRDPDAESDDLMASYAVKSFYEGWETILATADKDLLACVNDFTFIYHTLKKREMGGPEFELVDEAAVVAKWGVKPAQLSDLLALMGDDCDGIKGLDGVGPKTAAKWLNQHGSLRQVIASNAIAKVNDNRDLLLDNIAMTMLDEGLTLPLQLDALSIGPRTIDFSAAMVACGINEGAL